MMMCLFVPRPYDGDVLMTAVLPAMSVVEKKHL
jgi:hypothetical protein